MAKKKKDINQYTHSDKDRVNNPPIGLVTPETDSDSEPKEYSYDPHLDPQLVWSGKAEHISFEVPTVSLHVHERIDPQTVLETVQKEIEQEQISLFESEKKRPLREEIEFYKHKNNWTNRLIAGDSLLVMNSLLEKEGMAGQVQMIYIDPPYGISYGSNFQPFVDKRSVRDRRDEDLTQEPEMIKAFRDTWKLGIHSYLTYMRDRLLLAKELLHESGSCFVQIGEDNIHHIRELMDEVFEPDNFVSLITFKTKGMPLGRSYLPTISDYIVWYGKDINQLKFRKLFVPKTKDNYEYVELPDGKRRRLNKKERKNPDILPEGSKLFFSMDLRSSGRTESCVFEYEFEGKKHFPAANKSWKTNKEGMKRLDAANRLYVAGKTLRYVLYFDDYPISEITNNWMDTQGASKKMFVVQTAQKIVKRCMLMVTDPGDLVLDPTCGSGTTAYAAEKWGRRWITCDTSRVALSLAKKRLLTSYFDYYKLAHPDEGVSSGFEYKKVPHITLGSIANNEPADEETLYDQPKVDNSKSRITGPFTVEAVPAPMVKSLDETDEPPVADKSIARSGETARVNDWIDELKKTGIRAKGGKKIEFSRVEVLPGTKWLHADAETKEDEPQRAVISFGPEHAPLEQRQVALAIEEAQNLVPKPKIVAFAAFQFDSEAAKDIEETEWPGVTLIKAQMNADLLTEDLKKERASEDSFWLIGQSDVKITKIDKGEDKGKYQVEVLGFDYYNPVDGNIDSGGAEQIAMWMLDTDYDGRSLYPHQVFFPMDSKGEGWSKLAKNLSASINKELIEEYRGTVSIPFYGGKNKRVAVKIIDDRGIESLKIIDLP